jgi:hypothetical protein
VRRWSRTALRILAPYPEYLLDAKLVSRPIEEFIRAGYHINPSAEGLLVFSQDYKLAGELHGWELLTLPDGSIVYHQNQIHFAPTHVLQISVFNLSLARISRSIHRDPTIRFAGLSLKRVRAVYKSRGDAWFREHNHHMDPERFDSVLVGDVTLNAPQKSLSFVVRYGDPGNAADPLPFSQQVLVTCASIDTPVALRCHEAAR